MPVLTLTESRDSKSITTPGAYTVYGLGGNDSINSMVSRFAAGDLGDTFYGGGGNDVLRGGLTDDALFGDDGNDILNGGDGNDALWGGIGDDDLLGGFGNDVMDGGEGDDLLSGSLGDDTMRGGGGNDQLYGSSGDGELYGDDGDDEIFGGANDDLLDGGTGNDELSASDGADVLTGGGGNDTLNGGGGIDSFDGGAGDDMLLAGAGGETMAGGAGFDTIDYADATSAVAVDLRLGVVGGAAAGDVISGVEALIGSDFDDQLFGTNVDFNDLSGGIGNDVLATNGGYDDFLFGGDGADRIINNGGGFVSGTNPTSLTISNLRNYHDLYGGDGQDEFDIISGFSIIQDWSDGESIQIDNLRVGSSGNPLVASVQFSTDSSPATYHILLQGATSAISSYTFVDTGSTTTAGRDAVLAVLLNDVSEYI